MGRISDMLSGSQQRAMSRRRELPYFSINVDKYPQGKRVFFMAHPDFDEDWVVMPVHKNPIPNQQPFNLLCEGAEDCEHCRSTNPKVRQIAHRFAHVIYDIEEDELKVWEASEQVARQLNVIKLDCDIYDSVFRVIFNRPAYSISRVADAGKEDPSKGMLNAEQWEKIENAPSVVSLYPEMT